MIESYHLSPNQFEFSEGASKNLFEEKVTLLKYKQSEYYFLFDTGSNTSGHYAFFCPGNSEHTEKGYPQNWSGQLGYVENWLRCLIREINTPNKWERLKYEVDSLNINFEYSEDKFSYIEYEDLQKRMFVLKQGISKSDLLEEQIKVINDKLDHLTEMAKEMSKFDWKSLFIGTIVSIVIQLAVNQENAKNLWILIKQIFNTYMLP